MTGVQTCALPISPAARARTAVTPSPAKVVPPRTAPQPSPAQTAAAVWIAGQLSGGAIIEEGPAHEVLSNPRNPLTARFLSVMEADKTPEAVR